MTTITAALLLLGAALAGFGILAFLAAVPGWPDVETLHLTCLAARHGRNIGIVGLASWLTTWPTTNAGYTLLVAATLTTVALSCIVTVAAPVLMKRAAAWSF